MSQPNYVTFEVGIRIGGRNGQPAQTRTLAVHNLVVWPSSTDWTDQTRANVEQTNDIALVTKGFRQLREIRYEGTFGVEARGFGATAGTGEQRRRQFYTEVVRLPSVVSKRQLERELADGIRSPALQAALRGQVFEPGRDRLYVNLYDFWHQLRFECVIVSFKQTRSKASAAASGGIRYALMVKEVGPPVVSSLAGEVISLFQDKMGAWDAYNEAIRSFTPEAVIESVLSPALVPLVQAADLSLALEDQIDNVARLVSPIGGGTTRLSGTYYQAALDLGSSARAARDALTSEVEPEPPVGVVDDWNRPSRARRFEQIARTYDLEQAALTQTVIGSLFGADNDDWRAVMEGRRAPPSSSENTYVVTGGETGASIERRTGIRWGAILAANKLTPREALIPGTRLDLPQDDDLIELRPIPNLPVLGSHQGRAAWGSDVTPDLKMDRGPVIVEGEDILLQGLDTIHTELAEAFLSGAQDVPIGQRGDYVATRFASAVLADPRFIQILEARGNLVGSGVTIDLSATAINGGEIRAGSQNA